MSSPADLRRRDGGGDSARREDGRHGSAIRRDAANTVELRVDRIACTGHGVCASVLPHNIELDEWGYPIVRDPNVDADAAATAIRLCPARALYRP